MREAAFSLLSFPTATSKRDSGRSHLRPRNGGYLLRLEKPTLLMSSESKTNLPALDRAPAGKVAER